VKRKGSPTTQTIVEAQKKIVIPRLGEESLKIDSTHEMLGWPIPTSDGVGIRDFSLRSK
jgi:hypothetical protein